MNKRVLFVGFDVSFWQLHHGEALRRDLIPVPCAVTEVADLVKNADDIFGIVMAVYIKSDRMSVIGLEVEPLQITEVLHSVPVRIPFVFISYRSTSWDAVDALKAEFDDRGRTIYVQEPLFGGLRPQEAIQFLVDNSQA